MKKLDSFDPEFITKTYFNKIPRKMINHGYCFIWAYYSYLTFKNVDIWWNHFHAFTRWNGKFYDSDKPNGVDCWLDLPASKGCDCTRKHCMISPLLHARKTSITYFKNMWYEETNRFNTSWEEMEDKAGKTIVLLNGK